MIYFGDEHQPPSDLQIYRSTSTDLLRSVFKLFKLGRLDGKFGFSEWLPGVEVEEDCIQDGSGQGDGIDGVEQVDLLHDGHVREAVLLLRKISIEKPKI